MPNPIKGKSGRVLPESFSGPSSYPSGGFSHRTDLGRVDEAHPAETDNGAHAAKVSNISDNNAVVIQAFSAGGGELPAGTDLSGDTFRLTSYRL